MNRSNRKIDLKIDLVNTGSKNKIKVAVMLQLQHQKVVTMPQQCHFNANISDNCKNIWELILDWYANKVSIPRVQSTK